MRELAFICPACKQETPTQITRWAAHINVTTGETWRETCAHCGVEYQFDLRAKAVPNLFELLSKPAANGGAT